MQPPKGYENYETWDDLYLKCNPTDSSNRRKKMKEDRKVLGLTISPKTKAVEETGRPKSFRELVRDWRKWCDKIGYDCQTAFEAAMIDARKEDFRQLERLADEWEQLVVRTLQERERDDEPSAWFHISCLQQMLGPKEPQ